MEVAAWAVEDAMEGRSFARYPRGAEARHTYLRLCKAERPSRIALCLLVFLTVVEVPSWCARLGAPWSWLSPEERCFLGAHQLDAAPSRDAHPVAGLFHFSGVAIVPPGFVALLELPLVAVIFWRLFAEDRLHKQFKRLGVSYHRKSIRRVEAIACVLTAVEAMSALVLRWEGPFVFGGWCRLAPFARLVLVCCRPSVVRVLRACVRILRQLVRVGGMLLFAVAIFAWLGTFVLAEAAMRHGESVKEGFGSFRESLVTLLVATTSANFPGFMVPSLLKVPWIGVFFVAFLVIAVVVFTQVTLAVVVNIYRREMAGQLRESFEARVRGLNRAFRLCSREHREDPASLHKTGLESLIHNSSSSSFAQNSLPSPTTSSIALSQMSTSRSVPGFVTDCRRYCDRLIDLEDFKELITALNESGRNRAVKPEMMEVLFAALDGNGDGKVDADEFYQLCDLLQYNYWVSQRDSVFVRRFPGLFETPPLRRLREAVHHHIFDRIVLVLNICFFAIVDVAFEMADVPESIAWKLETFIHAVYVCEVLLKLSITSTHQFWQCWHNCFDLVFAAVLCLLASACTLQIHPPQEAFEILGTLRLLRLLRILDQVSAVRRVCRRVIKMFVASRDVVLLVLLALSVWACCGVHVWGGALYRGNPALVDTGYLQAGYDVFNFNDVPLAMLTLFVSLLSGHVGEFAEALTAVTTRTWNVTITSDHAALGVTATTVAAPLASTPQLPVDVSQSSASSFSLSPFGSVTNLLPTAIQEAEIAVMALNTMSAQIEAWGLAVSEWLPESGARLVLGKADPQSVAEICVAAYLGTFYIFAVLVSFNVFTAFTIDTYVALQDAEDEERAAAKRAQQELGIPDGASKREAAALQEIRSRFALRGLALHFSVTTELEVSRIYRSLLEDELGVDLPLKSLHLESQEGRTWSETSSE